MYHPYLRGKQNELILLRENTKLLKEANMVPIIEPVKSTLAPLIKTIENLKKDNVPFILIVNPRNGDFKNNPLPLFSELIDITLIDYNNFCLGYLVDSQSSLIDIKSFLDDNKDKSIAFIHNGYPKAKELSELLNSFVNIKKHIFLDDKVLYRKQFNKENIQRVLIKDGFTKKTNREYSEDEPFSELHLIYKDEYNMDGFGDFLIVGDEYSETGGPAYAIALHLTYLNEDSVMNIKHFISDRTNTPTDPAGKFIEALNKLINEVDQNNLIYKSEAYKQYKVFYEKGHFPGLGIAKKLSMQHHLEILAKFIKEQ